MKSPERTRKMPSLPLPPVPEFTIQELTSPSDTISHLSQPSVVGTTNFSLPLKATDIGIPKSPVQRVVLPVNEEVYEEGYDSDCYHAPWEGSEEVNFEIREAEEEPLPSGPTLGTPVPSEDNHDEKMVSIDDASKMKVSELREELKKRGLSSKGNKIELLSRLNIGIANKTPLLVNLTKNNKQIWLEIVFHLVHTGLSWNVMVLFLKRQLQQAFDI